MQVKYTSTRILMVTSSLKISHWCVFLTDKMSIFRTHCQIIQIDSFHQYSHLVKHSTELPPHTTNGRLVGVTHCLLVCCSVWSDLPWEQLATGISSPLSCGTKHFCIKTRLKTTKWTPRRRPITKINVTNTVNKINSYVKPIVVHKKQPPN